MMMTSPVRKRRQHRRHKLLPKSNDPGRSLARPLNDRVHSRSVIWRARSEGPHSTPSNPIHTTTQAAAAAKIREGTVPILGFVVLLPLKNANKTMVEKW